jgi:hypothetical protein
MTPDRLQEIEDTSRHFPEWQPLCRFVAELAAEVRALQRQVLQVARDQPPAPTDSHAKWVGCGAARDSIMELIRRPKADRTKADVMRLKNEGAVYGGCCSRFADNSGCDCLTRARN